MAVVPVGITKHREHLTPMRLFSKPEAAAIVDKVTVWQQECREKFGKSFVYLGDEFYLLAENNSLMHHGMMDFHKSKMALV